MKGVGHGVELGALLSAASKLVSAEWLNMGIIILEGVVIARAIGVEGFGAWALVQAVFTTVGALLSFRTAEALTRYLVRGRASGDLRLQGLLIQAAYKIDLVSYTVVFFIGSITGALFLDSALGDFVVPGAVLWIYGISIIARYNINTWESLLRVDRRFWRISILPAFVNAGKLLVLILLWTVGSLDIMALSITTGAFSCLFAILRYRDIKECRSSQELPNVDSVWLPWRHPALLEFWRFMRIGFFTGSLSGVVKSADVLVLGYMRSEQDVGWYRLAKSLVSSLQKVAITLGRVVFLDISEWIERKQLNKALKFLYATTIKLLPYFLIGYLVSSAVIWVLIPLIYGEEFLPARELFLILLAGTWVASVLFWVNSLLLAMEKLHAHMYIQIINLVITAILLGLLTYAYGVKGTAIAISCAWAIGHLNALGYLYYTFRTKRISML